MADYSSGQDKKEKLLKWYRQDDPDFPKKGGFETETGQDEPAPAPEPVPGEKQINVEDIKLEDFQSEAVDHTADPEAEEISKTEKEKSEKEQNKVLHTVFDWVKVVVIALAAALLINTFLIVNSIVPSGSMIPTIQEGTRMIGWRLSYKFGNEPQRGDIVIFRYPDNPSEIFVKRVIGTPGDTVEIIGGVTYVNGEILEEPYLNNEPLDMDFGPYNVPEDSYFMMGDNRNNSRDSRYWKNTFVNKDAILAKAVFSYWPLSAIGALK